MTETKKTPKARYLLCPWCDAAFKLVPGDPVPPHKWLGAPCKGVGEVAS